MQFIESSVIGVRSAVLTLGRRTSPLRFVLFPMVHVAEQGFYDESALRERFRYYVQDAEWLMVRNG